MPYKKKWNEIVPATQNLLEISLTELVNTHLDFKNKNLIFFDLETLGFHPTFEYEQIIELAAISVNGDTLKPMSEICHKITLLNEAKKLINEHDSVERYNWERRQKKRGKTAFTSPTDILRFTKYNENKSQDVSEMFALSKFFKFIEDLSNVVLIAHNTEFDINYLICRGQRYGLKLPNVEILDTLKLSRFFFIPTLKTLNNNNFANEILSRLTRHQPKQKKKIHFSSRLGDLASAMEIDTTNWHTANADTKMLYELLVKMKLFFETNVNVDISKNKEIAFKSAFRKIKK